ncbi:MAG: hypothetical protein NT153_11670 [Bacteroidetes bacterium]|nr:hypothetical protein [Bacteroidota bacterium]
MYPIVKKMLLLLCLISCTNIILAQNKHKKKAATQKTSTKKKSKAASKKSKKTTNKQPDKKTVATDVLPNTNTAIVTAATISRAALTDTSNPKEVLITSSFKPSLRNAAKINFSATTPFVDTTKLILTYRVPSQNLFFSYQPVPIKPLALAADSAYAWQNSQYIKLGFGNFTTPFAQLGLSFGDGLTHIVSVNAQHVSSKGNINFQEFGKTAIGVSAIINTPDHLSYTGKVSYMNSTQYLYGFQPSSLNFSKDNLLQAFNTFGVEFGVENTVPTAAGLNYHPEIKAIYFSANAKANETNLIVTTPFSKTFDKDFNLSMGLNANIASYNNTTNTRALQFNNNVFFINPTIGVKKSNLTINLGVSPTWNKQQFSMLPNISAEAKIKASNISVELGWLGSYQVNSLRKLAGINPFIEMPNSNILNTKIIEQYLGFKGSAGNHLSFNARLSLLQLFDQPLFMNNNTDGKTFNVVYDQKIQAIKLHAEAGYREQEKFSVIGALNLFEYSSLTNYEKAYGLIPMEISGTFKWKMLKSVNVKAEAILRDGSAFLSKSLQSSKLSPTADINLGADIKLLPKLSIWLQMNNLLNNTYQRWNQYNVLGFNVLGGVVYSFK